MKCRFIHLFPTLFFFFLIFSSFSYGTVVEDYVADLSPQYSRNQTFSVTNGFDYLDYWSDGLVFFNSDQTAYAALLGSWQGGPDSCNVQVSPPTSENNYFRIESVGSNGNSVRGGVMYILTQFLEITEDTVICYNLTTIATDETYLTFFSDDETGFCISPSNTAASYPFGSITCKDQNAVDFRSINGFTCLGYANLSSDFNEINLTNIYYLAVEFTSPGDARNFYLDDIYIYNVTTGQQTIYNDTEIDFTPITDQSRDYDNSIFGGADIFNTAFYTILFVAFILLLIWTESVPISFMVLGITGFIISYIMSGDVTQMVSSLILVAIGIASLLSRGLI